MAILYDYPTLSTAHDKAIEDVDKNFQRVSQAANPGSSLVEFFPWMLYIPQRCGLSLQLRYRLRL
jgi:hypothetical protein